jgi:hypothetical protein
MLKTLTLTCPTQFHVCLQVGKCRLTQLLVAATHLPRSKMRLPEFRASEASEPRFRGEDRGMNRIMTTIQCERNKGSPHLSLMTIKRCSSFMRVVT